MGSFCFWGNLVMTSQIKKPGYRRSKVTQTLPFGKSTEDLWTPSADNSVYKHIDLATCTLQASKLS